jgi:hypothetical protein
MRKIVEIGLYNCNSNLVANNYKSHVVANGMIAFSLISSSDKSYNLLGLWTLKGTVSNLKLPSKSFFEHIESKSKGSYF